MAFVLSDRIKETTTTTSTGTYTLGGAVSGFETFTANLSNGDTTYYCCTDGTDFEVGLGTFASSGTTLARTTIISSSNSNNAVSWSSGSRDIFCTLPGSKAVFKNGDSHVDLSDNEKLRIGTGNDLEIYHDGSNSFILSDGTGHLHIRADADIKLQKDNGENYAIFNADGAVELYHDNSKRFETTSTGAKVTGGTGDGTFIIEADTDNATESDNALLQLIQDGGAVGVEFGLDSNNKIFMKGTGASGDIEFKHGDENLAILKADGAAELYHDNSKKFETTSSGATVTGTLAATLSTAAQPNITSLGTLTTLTVDDITINGSTISHSGNLFFDSGADMTFDAAGNDFIFQVNGTQFFRIANSSSDAILKPVADAKDIIFQQRDGTEVARVEDNGTFNVVTDKLAINGTAITSTAAEINKLDGVTATTTELNYVDVTTLGTVQASKAVTADANGDIATSGDITLQNGTNSILRFLSADGTSQGYQIKANISNSADFGLLIEDKDNNDIAKFLDGGECLLTHNHVTKFQTTSDGATVTGDLEILSTDAGASEDPNLVLYRNSSSPADDDQIGTIQFKGRNDNSQDVIYGEIQSAIQDASDGVEESSLSLQVRKDGSATTFVSLSGASGRVNIQQELFLTTGVGMKFEGATSNANETTFTVTDPTADRTITLPDATGTVLTTGNSDTPTTTTSSSDADFVLVDDGGTMKKITPSNLGITSGGASKGFAVAMAIAL